MYVSIKKRRGELQYLDYNNFYYILILFMLSYYLPCEFSKLYALAIPILLENQNKFMFKNEAKES